MGVQELKVGQELRSENKVKEEAIKCVANVYIGSQFYESFADFQIISPQEIVVKRFGGKVERIYNATVIVKYKDKE